MPKQYRILWIDDDAGGLLSPLERIFEKAGIAVDTAQDVSTALHRIETTNYDAFLVDLVLPYGGSALRPSVAGGSTFIRHVRDIEERKGSSAPAPIVVLSVMSKAESAGLLEGLNTAYFSKLELTAPDAFKRLVEALTKSSSAAEPGAAPAG